MRSPTFAFLEIRRVIGRRSEGLSLSTHFRLGSCIFWRLTDRRRWPTKIFIHAIRSSFRENGLSGIRTHNQRLKSLAQAACEEQFAGDGRRVLAAAIGMGEPDFAESKLHKELSGVSIDFCLAIRKVALKWRFESTRSQALDKSQGPPRRGTRRQALLRPAQRPTARSESAKLPRRLAPAPPNISL
jgi:hypothetical protein